MWKSRGKNTEQHSFAASSVEDEVQWGTVGGRYSAAGGIYLT